MFFFTKTKEGEKEPFVITAASKVLVRTSVGQEPGNPVVYEEKSGYR